MVNVVSFGSQGLERESWKKTHNCYNVCLSRGHGSLNTRIVISSANLHPRDVAIFRFFFLHRMTDWEKNQIEHKLRDFRMLMCDKKSIAYGFYF